MSTSSTYPRLYTLTPSQASLASSDLENFAFQITGLNLPCSASAAGCSTTVRFLQGSNTYTASCTGSSAGTTLDCIVDIESVVLGNTQLVVIAGGNTLTLPAAPLIGGLVVSP